MNVMALSCVPKILRPAAPPGDAASAEEKIVRRLLASREIDAHSDQHGQVEPHRGKVEDAETGAKVSLRRRQNGRGTDAGTDFTAGNDPTVAPFHRRRGDRGKEFVVRLIYVLGEGAGLDPGVGDCMIRENCARKAGVLDLQRRAVVNVRTIVSAEDCQMGTAEQQGRGRCGGDRAGKFGQLSPSSPRSVRPGVLEIAPFDDTVGAFHEFNTAEEMERTSGGTGDGEHSRRAGTRFEDLPVPRGFQFGEVETPQRVCCFWRIGSFSTAGDVDRLAENRPTHKGYRLRHGW